MNSPSRQYIMGTSTELHQISTINEENDLGITFTRNFKFRAHVYKIAQKANNVLGIIKCAFKYLEPNVSTVWNTHILEDIETIDKIQRKAIKLIPSLLQ